MGLELSQRCFRIYSQTVIDRPAFRGSTEHFSCNILAQSQLLPNHGWEELESGHGLHQDSRIILRLVDSLPKEQASVVLLMSSYNNAGGITKAKLFTLNRTIFQFVAKTIFSNIFSIFLISGCKTAFSEQPPVLGFITVFHLLPKSQSSHKFTFVYAIKWLSNCCCYEGINMGVLLIWHHFWSYFIRQTLNK